MVPSGVDVPETVAEPDEPPHVLFVGRLSEEKGIAELVEATRGNAARRRRRRAAPRRGCPTRSASSPPGALGPYYERAAVVVCPSRREGYGVVAREAMAHGRPVVASAVGGLVDAVEDGVTGLLVPPRRPGALRAALERLLGDASCASRLGAAARERARDELSWKDARPRRRSPPTAPRSSRSRRAPEYDRGRARAVVDGKVIARDGPALRHRRDRPQPPGRSREGEGALPRGEASAARTRSSSRSATTGGSTRARYYDSPYDNENSYGSTYGEHREALELADRATGSSSALLEARTASRSSRRRSTSRARTSWPTSTSPRSSSPPATS